MMVVVDGEYLNWWKCLVDADDISVTFVQVNLGNVCIHLGGAFGSSFRLW